MTATVAWAKVRIAAAAHCRSHVAGDVTLLISFGKDGEGKVKSKSETSKGKGKKKKKRKNSEEALEDSDDGDYEGLEVDYMSDESRSKSHAHSAFMAGCNATRANFKCFVLPETQLGRRTRKGKTKQGGRTSQRSEDLSKIYAAKDLNETAKLYCSLHGVHGITECRPFAGIDEASESEEESEEEKQNEEEAKEEEEEEEGKKTPVQFEKKKKKGAFHVRRLLP